MAVFLLVPAIAATQVTFYDAYELGLAHERAGRWSSAVTAFETAVSIRPTAGRDVQTFGRDTLDVYDPFLHLARVEIKLGRFPEAKKHLAVARAAGVSSHLEIENLTAKLEFSPEIDETPTAKPVPQTSSPTPALRPTPSRTRAVRPPSTAAVVLEIEAQALKETATPTVTATTHNPGNTAESTKDGGAGGWLLLVTVLAAIVAIIIRRRRAKAKSDPELHYDSTPTRRVDSALVDSSRPVSESSSVRRGGYEDRRLGNFRVITVLGRGGMATTYRAEHVNDGRVVALKVPHEHLLDDAEFNERFLREGSLGATIHHPNIIRIFEAGRHEHIPFIAMELVDGVTLQAHLVGHGKLPVPEALEITRGIALALDYAHVKGVVHRDVKPDNIMLLADGTVKVMDFGIARVAATPGLTATNTYLGTPLYSAPEAICPDEVGPQSDLYSLGIVLFRMLSGEVPFEASSPFKVVELHRTAPLPRFSPEHQVPEKVETMVRRLTAKRLCDRYPSAEVFLHDLNQYLSG